MERLGFDENFVDVTGLVEKRLLQGGLFEDAEVVGHQYGEKPSGMEKKNSTQIGLLNT